MFFEVLKQIVASVTAFPSRLEDIDAAYQQAMRSAHKHDDMELRPRCSGDIHRG